MNSPIQYIHEIIQGELSCCAGKHNKFRAFESSSYVQDGRVFTIQYGSGHLMGVMARELLRVL